MNRQPYSRSLAVPRPQPTRLLFTALFLLTWLLATACGAETASADAESTTPEPAQEEAMTSPIIIELFTSQGCSSCPPADRLLARLEADPKLKDRVLPLAFHVDYWNSIGWQDPFSSELWSRRQERYAQSLATGRLYTPQLVVAGRDHCVGSRESQVRGLIEDELARPSAATVRIQSLNRGEATVSVTAAAELQGSVDGPQELMVALVESGLSTQVQSGENAHRTLENERVVRRLESVARLDPSSATSVQGTAEFSLDPSWDPQELEVVAFLQDRNEMVIHGATEGKVLR
ncbi:MAG: DUF1223 domain-containing protein [Acidobacteriota bacterium]|nr:DUF1223 domain-containing protein [Acidobacteriota bacterium]